MPTYEYECVNCGYRFEKFQSITASALTKCPACKKNRLKRLIGKGAGIIFKGEGFYATDYKKGKDTEKKPEQIEKSSKSSCCSCSASDCSTCR
jgi:putative FmdB family regulatory protein